MRLSRIQALALTAALAVIIGLGSLGSYAAYEEELNQQMHGVEPGPEATRALVREAAIGFLAGAMIGSAGVAALGVAVFCFRRRRTR
jgi:hypothetical protein